MENNINNAVNFHIPESTIIEKGVIFGRDVILEGDNIILRENCRLGAGCVIGEGVVVGSNAWVRAGSVCLRSIPPNAVVEGNPAIVVGYLNSIPNNPFAATRIFDSSSLGGLSRPSKVSVGVGECAIFLMRKIIDPRGCLTVGEVPTEVPFSPARYFAVYGVPSIELRGEHAHKRCQQFLICLHGSCRVLLDDGLNRCEVILDSPDIGVFMPEMIWGTQYRYSVDSVLLVFASRPYETEDYLRTYDEFIAEVRKPSILD